MPRKWLTDVGVKRQRPPDKGQVDYFDTVVPGLVLRISYGGTKTWRALYYRGGKPRYAPIGRYPIFSLSDARSKARVMLQAAAEGKDPKSARSIEGNTIDRVVDDFIERYAKPRNRSWKETQRLLQRELVANLSGRAITTITRHDILNILDTAIAREAPILANRTLAAARKMFNWAVERGILEASPISGLPSQSVEVSRRRVLSDAELKTLWAAWSKLGWPWAQYFQVLLLTGQRRSEVASMRWSQLTLGGKEPIWKLPEEIVKNKQPHDVPLSRQVLDILENAPRFSGEFVFSTTGGTRPISGFSKAKRESDEALAKLTKNSGVTFEPWRVHDLRRTAASGMAQAGVLPHVVSAVLNHSPSRIMGITAVYVRHRYDHERRKALNAWGLHVHRLASGQQDNVVALSR
jgi:integrase